MSNVTEILIYTSLVFCVAFVLGATWNRTNTDRLTQTIEELMEILNESQYKTSPEWGDWFINWQGISQQLPAKCPEGYDMTPEDFITIHSMPPWEKNR